METLSVNIDLKLPHSEKRISFLSGPRLALTGPSGCGKSTLVKVLAGVSDRGMGSFKLEGKEMTILKPWERGIGFVPQDLILLPHLTVAENLAFPKNGKLDPEVNDGLGITHLLKRMPKNLSGGEKQRVALARALSSQTRLLIMDEPFSSLDLKNKEKIVHFVDQFIESKKIPFIFISHEEKEIQLLRCETFLMA